MRLICTATLIVSFASPAFAQERHAGEPPPRLIISERAVAMGIAATPPATIQQSSRDSLKNGTIIGAVIGGVAMGTFFTYLCHALKEEGDPPCWKGVLTTTALGAGAGAAAGAGLDALFARQHSAWSRPSSRR
jgi:hypothetical protein